MDHGVAAPSRLMSLVGGGFGVGLRSLRPMVPIYVLTYGAMVLWNVLPLSPRPEDNSRIFLWMTALGGVVLMVALYWAITAAFVSSFAEATGRPLRALDLMRRALRRLMPMFVAQLLFSFSCGIGFLLFVVPGVYLGVRFGCAGAAVAGDGYGPLRGLGQSWALVRGHWWRSAAALGLAGLPQLIALMLLLGIFTRLLPVPTTPADVANPVHAAPSAWLWAQCLWTICGCVGFQLFCGVQARLYLDLQARALNEDS